MAWGTCINLFSEWLVMCRADDRLFQTVDLENVKLERILQKCGMQCFQSTESIFN